jgi:DNA-directed RNA polymerase I subunit RPA43
VFNASVPRHHIPSESWEFEYGPAENDPEVALEEEPTTREDPSGGDVEMAEGVEQTPDKSDHPEASTSSGGRWVHNMTGDMVGGKSGYVEFTVIGLVSFGVRRSSYPTNGLSLRLTMANQMLSVIGSIQPDPFSPEHVPKRAAPVSPEPEEADEVQNQLAMESAAADDLEYSDEANRTFRRLGKRADEAKRAGLKAREEAEVAAVAVKAAKKGKKKRRAEDSITQDKDKKAKKAKRKKVE